MELDGDGVIHYCHCINHLSLMLFDDTYKTIEGPSTGIFKDKGSKFIAFAFQVETDGQIKQHLQALRKEHFNARHHCYAYRLGADKQVFRMNDDGEPSGTAGRPIYNQILSQDLTNILIVVVRYFGGSLLGVPGLINAYKMAAIEALQSVQVIEKIIREVYRFDFDYLQMNDVMKIVKDFQLHIRHQQYELRCSIEVEIRLAELDQVLALFSKIPGIEQEFRSRV